MANEPEQLKRGKKFQAAVQADWEVTAQGNICIEATIRLEQIRKKTGRRKRGRMDIFVNEIGVDYVSVVEIKATDWDLIKDSNITKNLGSHRRQIYKYIEEYLDGEGVSACPGLIYPTAPKTEGLRDRIEEYLGSYGIAVVWYYE